MFVENTDLEWLSLNWRKYRAQVISKSNRRVILHMFEQDYQYFPTLRNIKDGLMRAQMSQLNQEKREWHDKTKFRKLKDSYASKWKILFEIDQLGDIDKPLTAQVLCNPYHPITKHILFLYSMEDFIYQGLNKTCRDKQVK